jgi:hypothetical protein
MSDTISCTTEPSWTAMMPSALMTARLIADHAERLPRD